MKLKICALLVGTVHYFYLVAKIGSVTVSYLTVSLDSTGIDQNTTIAMHWAHRQSPRPATIAT